MNPKFHGDSYEFAKQGIIEGLAPLGGWAIHPMYYDYSEEPFDPGFAGYYADFLGIRLVDHGECPRNEVAAVGGRCQQHLFVDPDTGLWAGEGRPRDGQRKHIRVTEFAEIANAPGREDKLTLVYDQSYPNGTIENKREQAGAKLATLFHDHNLHGAAYVSHVPFIWVSRDEGVFNNATQRLLRKLAFPHRWFVGIGQG